MSLFGHLLAKKTDRALACPHWGENKFDLEKVVNLQVARFALTQQA